MKRLLHRMAELCLKVNKTTIMNTIMNMLVSTVKQVQRKWLQPE